MQPNQLSCLALGVCFLWGHLRFISSKGTQWFYWNIQRIITIGPLWHENVYVWGSYEDTQNSNDRNGLLAIFNLFPIHCCTKGHVQHFLWSLAQQIYFSKTSTISAAVLFSCTWTEADFGEYFDLSQLKVYIFFFIWLKKLSSYHLFEEIQTA